MTTFTPDELTALQAAGLAVFEGRVIHEAQPPITPEVLAAIQARCAGPVPEALIALWSTSFGGRLDYDLSLRLSDTVSAFSFAEIFYPDSHGYHDPWGWMDEQLAFESHDGLLHFLPFGGFEYTDRLFVDLRDGSVVAYMRGLPPAWVHRLHEDVTGRVATDVRDLFRQLALEDDPYAPTQEYAQGGEVREAIDEVESASARDKLHALLRSVVVDWRGALDDGSVSRDERARRLAWGEVVRSDDVALLDRLVDLGCSPAEVLGGGGAPVDHAAARGSLSVVRRLLALDVPVDGALETGSTALPLDLCRELARRDPDVET
ncbi:MAG: SMI1/KNR4 family protein [Myxococcales bacterium]|nr:SMI1/KNR4 family protein [Myxococcales bacterium]